MNRIERGGIEMNKLSVKNTRKDHMSQKERKEYIRQQYKKFAFQLMLNQEKK